MACGAVEQDEVKGWFLGMLTKVLVSRRNQRKNCLTCSMVSQRALTSEHAAHGARTAAPHSHWEYFVGQPIVFALSKYVVVISDSQLWNCTRVQSFFFFFCLTEKAALIFCGRVSVFSPVFLTGMPRLPFFPENRVREEFEPRHHWPEQGNRLRWVTRSVRVL